MDARDDFGKGDAAGIAEGAALARRHPVDDGDGEPGALQISRRRDADDPGADDRGVRCWGVRHLFPSPLWGGVRGGGREVSIALVQKHSCQSFRAVSHFDSHMHMILPPRDPHPSPSPQGGGE